MVLIYIYAGEWWKEQYKNLKQKYIYKKGK